MTAEEFLAAHHHNLGAHLNIRFTDHKPDEISAEMDAGASHLTVGGRVHGGALMAFADTVAAFGAVLNLPSSRHSTTTLESKTNFFRAAMPGIVKAKAVPLHRGRSTMVWQTNISSPDGKLIAVVSQTQMVLSPRS